VKHQARIRWSSAAERGRPDLPATLRYVGLSRFAEDAADWPNGAWSVELTFDEPPPEQGNSRVSEGYVRFLFDEAPQERLARGVRFDLFEGLTQVAQVEVVD